MIDYIQILGLHCSGTNALEVLTNKACKIQVGQKYGNKHMPIESAIPSNVLVLYVQKEVWAWLVSMRESPHGERHKTNWTLSKYIRSSWRGDLYKEDFDNPLKYREYNISKWNEKKKLIRHTKTIKHIDLIKNPKGIIEEIAKQYDIVADNINGAVSSLSTYKGLGYTPKFFRHKYYLNRDYMQKYSFGDIEFVKNNYNFSLEI